MAKTTSFCELFRTSDRIRADALKALFRSEGIVFRRHGGAGPALGTLLHDYRLEVPEEDRTRAQALLNVFASQSSNEPTERESGREPSWLRRHAPLLVRIWLFVFGGFCLSVPLLYLSRWADESGFALFDFIPARRLPVLCMSVGLILAFIERRELRNRAALLMLAALIVVSLLGHLR